MPPADKWIEGFGTESDVADVARAAVESRLAAVVYWLPAAAYCADHDVEHVHRLRVATRRALAAMQLFRNWLPEKAVRRLTRQLKKIRRAAGAARDLDVFAERLPGAEVEGIELVRAEVAEHRRAAQPAIEQLADRLRHEGRFQRKVGRVLESMKPRGNEVDGQLSPKFGEWAKVELAAEAQRFFDATPDDNRDPAALHQFRILGKRLRYIIELLAGGLDAEIRDKQYPAMEELQDRLGDVNDHAWAADQLREWSSQATDAARTQALQVVAQQELQQFEMALVAYREWWTPERADALKRGLGCDQLPEDSLKRTILVS